MLTEQHQKKLQVCENNWVRRITRTKRVDRRRMNDLRKEVGMQCSLTGRLVRSRMRWADHLVRTDASKLAKRTEVKKHQGRRKSGRPQLRWEVCVMRDMRNSGEDERWRGGGRYKTMERKNRKSGSTILYPTFTPVQQGTRRKSTLFNTPITVN